MCPRDRLDEREPEAGSAAGATHLRTGEALERVRKKRRREACSLVRDAEDDTSIVLSGHEAHSPRAVAKRVVDEIAKCLFQPQPVAGDCEGGGGVDLDLTTGGGEPPCDRLEQLAGADRLLAQPQLSLVRTREDEQILGEPHEPVGFLGS